MPGLRPTYLLGNGHYYDSDSADLLKWSAKKDLPGGLSGTVRRGTVLPK